MYQFFKYLHKFHQIFKSFA